LLPIWSIISALSSSLGAGCRSSRETIGKVRARERFAEETPFEIVGHDVLSMTRVFRAGCAILQVPDQSLE
jgi:hypothetical protein